MELMQRSGPVLSRRVVLGAGVAGAVTAACGSSTSESASTGPPVHNPGDGWKRLQAGNKRFTDGKLAHPRRDSVRRAEQADHQTPFVVVLGCSDSRVPPEIVFDEGIGDVFTVRVAGNTASDPVTQGSIEYAAAVLGCVLVVVLGHENCGAVKAAVDQVKTGKTAPGHIADVVAPILPAAQAAGDLDAAIKENVRRTVQGLTSLQPTLAGLVTDGKLQIVGAEYHLHTGVVEQVT